MIQAKFFPALFLFFLSCNEIRNPHNLIEIDIDKAISENQLSISSIFNGFDIIPLETPNDQQFGRVDDIVVNESNIFIFDRNYFKGILIFLIDGTFKSSIQMLGRGPGEYTQAPDFDVDEIENEIYIMDWAIGKLCIYDFEGNFLREIRLNRRYSSFASQSSYLYLGNSLNDGDPLIIADKSGNPIKTLLENNSVFRINILDLSGLGNFFKRSEELYISYPYNPTIYQIKDKDCTKYIEIISETFDYNKERGRKRVEEISVQELSNLSRISSFSRSDNLLFFKYYLNHQRYYTFYSISTLEVISCSKIVDDLTFTNPELLLLHEDKMIALLDSYHILELKKKILNGYEMIQEDLVSQIVKQDLNNNFPILILFHVKSDI